MPPHTTCWADLPNPQRRDCSSATDLVLTGKPEGGVLGKVGLRHVMSTMNIDPELLTELHLMANFGGSAKFEGRVAGDLLEELGSLTAVTLSGVVGGLPEALLQVESFAKNLRRVTVTDCPQVATWPEHLLRGLRALRYLRVERLVSLTAFPSNAFADLTAIISVTIVGNPRLQSLAELKPSNLERLDVRDGALTALPSGLLRGAFKMHYLNIANNRIRSLEPELLADSRGLGEIWMSFNPLERIPGNFFRGLHQLTQIEAESCALAEIPEVLTQDLAKVTRFALENNALTWLSSRAVSNMPALTSMSLMGNRMTAVDPKLYHKNPKLVKSDLSLMNITHFPRDLYRHNPELDRVYLYGNPVKTLPKELFRHNPELTSLRIELLPYKSLHPSTFWGLTKLRELNMNGTNLMSLDKQHFRDLAQLRILDLSNTLLTHLPHDLFVHRELSSSRSALSLTVGNRAGFDKEGDEPLCVPPPRSVNEHGRWSLSTWPVGRVERVNWCKSGEGFKRSRPAGSSAGAWGPPTCPGWTPGSYRPCLGFDVGRSGRLSGGQATGSIIRALPIAAVRVACGLPAAWLLMLLFRRTTSWAQTEKRCGRRARRSERGIIGTAPVREQ